MANSHILIKPFASAHSYARRTILVLKIAILLSIFEILITYFRFFFRIYSAKLIEITDIVSTIIVLVLIALYIISSVLFFIWLYRAHRNLPSLGANNLRFSSGWAVGWFFVPIMNFFKPYQVVAEIWEFSNPNIDVLNNLLKKEKRISPLVIGWWVFCLLAWIIHSIGQFLKDFGLYLSVEDTSLQEFMLRNFSHRAMASQAFEITTDAFVIGLFLFTIVLIKEIDFSQEVKFKSE